MTRRSIINEPAKRSLNTEYLRAEKLLMVLSLHTEGIESVDIGKTKDGYVAHIRFNLGQVGEIIATGENPWSAAIQAAWEILET